MLACAGGVYREAKTERSCVRQSGKCVWKVSARLRFESTEYAGRRAGVGYSAVVMCTTRLAISGRLFVADAYHGALGGCVRECSRISSANPAQLVSPAAV